MNGTGGIRFATVDLDRYLADRVRRQPVATLSIAAGVGYVLGGGLATRFTIDMLGIAARLAATLAVRELATRQLLHPAASTNETGA